MGREGGQTSSFYLWKQSLEGSSTALGVVTPGFGKLLTDEKRGLWALFRRVNHSIF